MLTCGVLTDENERESETSLSHIPEAWVRVAMLIRLQSLTRGYSGVKPSLASSICSLLRHNIVPRVPVRGSISASGDLIPLSYLAATLQGSSGVQVWHDSKEGRTLVNADEALSAHKLEKFVFGPGEAVSLVNGTAVSAAAAALCMDRVHGAILQSMAITALSVEAIHGSMQSFDPLLSKLRPHNGQTELADSLRSFLQGSRLVRAKWDASPAGEMFQDRYSIRTVPQWLGPELENLRLAHHQVLIECNSVTDNPILDEDGCFLQGGNFQASSVASAMDSARNSLSVAGRMIFHQMTELMSPSTSNGLPPNLTADDPSLDYLMKALDVSAASYQSELTFLASRVSGCIMPAEQGNQSLNSLALISARYTHKSADVFQCLSAAALFALCQALDLRVIQFRFEELFRPLFEDIIRQLPLSRALDEELHSKLWTAFISVFKSQANQSYQSRIEAGAKGLYQEFHREAGNSDEPSKVQHRIPQWVESIEKMSIDCLDKVWLGHSESVCMSYLGRLSQDVYSFVRKDLRIPFIRSQTQSIRNEKATDMSPTEIGSLGKYVTSIYKNIGTIRYREILLNCLIK